MDCPHAVTPHTPGEIASAREDLERLLRQTGFAEPDRGDLDDPNIQWREGRPDYSIANLTYLKGKTKNHQPGSLEMVVENLIKTWEMEASHKINFRQWTTVDHDVYSVQANGGRIYRSEECCQMGNYNVLLDNCRKDLYDNQQETFESSHVKFRGAFPRGEKSKNLKEGSTRRLPSRLEVGKLERGVFPRGFPFEVLEVYAGPPKVVFSWRHWANFDGSYKGLQGKGELIEMTGFGVVMVNDSLKVQSIEIYYDPNPFLEVLTGLKKPDALKSTGAARGERIMKDSSVEFLEPQDKNR
ncbi:unnamed protein product [Cyprideis torosa]|uniref:Uncharacterized protein n=1 Tax=Cyprideis torosa TaxID=163714 RepID=A0A7R8W884_9CRUS|nr:unnamed protein product [Cyprideis torosa]CAG0888337.1 unnamed protein product [Cyprideis torosa]